MFLQETQNKKFCFIKSIEKSKIFLNLFRGHRFYNILHY
jgi:hypothetical protein